MSIRRFIRLASALAFAAGSITAAVALTSPASAAVAGDGLWTKTFDARFQSAAVSPDGATVFVTGSTSGSPYGYATVAYSASTGTKLWARRYGGPDHLGGQASALVVSPDATRVFVTGTITGGYGTVAYDASTGAKLWAKSYDGVAFAYSIAVMPDGKRVFVTGLSDSGCATVAYRASSGAELWAKRYANCTGYAVAVSPDGTKVFVTGQSFSKATGKNGYITIAYATPTGERLWAKRYFGPFGFFDGPAYALVVSPDGMQVFVTGAVQTDPSTGIGDAATVAYDASTGEKLWAKRYDGPSGGDDGAKSIAVSSDGTKLFVTGYSSDLASGEGDYLTVAYDASTGVKVWAKRYDGPESGNDAAWSVAASPDGTKLFVTGSSAGSTTGDDYATVAYNSSTGARLWAKRYNGPTDGQDIAWSVVASPDGTKVFVSGSSVTGGATIAYAA